MSKRAAVAGVALGVICAVGGCGTTANLEHALPALQRGWSGAGPPFMYGGVRADVEVLSGAFEVVRKGWSESPVLCTAFLPVWAAGVVYIATFDIPLSFVWDTITLPITIAAELNRKDPPPAPTREAEDGRPAPAAPRPPGL